jgi:hypothetical protein
MLSFENVAEDDILHLLEKRKYIRNPFLNNYQSHRKMGNKSVLVFHGFFGKRQTVIPWLWKTPVKLLKCPQMKASENSFQGLILHYRGTTV